MLCTCILIEITLNVYKLVSGPGSKVLKKGKFFSPILIKLIWSMEGEVKSKGFLYLITMFVTIYCIYYQCTEVHFASFLSSAFTIMVVINPERKLVKHTSVQCPDSIVVNSLDFCACVCGSIPSIDKLLFRIYFSPSPPSSPNLPLSN